MKRLGLLLALAIATSAFAQPGNPSGTGINASLLNMFGDIKAFSAKGEVRIVGKGGGDTTTLPVSMAMRDGKLRVEMNMSEMQSPSIPPQAAAMLAQTGMDRMQMLIDANSSILIYPGLQAYAPAPEGKAAVQGKVETADIGQETVGGHPCIKRKLTITDAKGKKEEALVWAATDLKHFPVKMEMQQRNNTVQIVYTAPSLDTPDAKLFAIPSDYKKYDSMQGLMQGVMMKMFSK